MKLGILDIAGIEEAIALAPLAETLGYERYWIAEHPPQPSPTLMAALIASQTERIRIGTGGVLLHYHAPARVADDFHLLERAFPGRIDAGFCAGLAPRPDLVDETLDARTLDARTLMARYPDRARRFVRRLRNTRADPSFDPSRAWPEAGDEPPEIWSLGSSERSARLAAELGLGFGYALMFTDSQDQPEIAQRYRAGFVPHRDRATARVLVAVGAVCADTDEEAHEIARAAANGHFTPRIIGGPAMCAAALVVLRERYGADEIMILALCPTRDQRARCYELLARACGLRSP